MESKDGEEMSTEAAVSQRHAPLLSGDAFSEIYAEKKWGGELEGAPRGGLKNLTWVGRYFHSELILQHKVHRGHPIRRITGIGKDVVRTSFVLEGDGNRPVHREEAVVKGDNKSLPL